MAASRFNHLSGAALAAALASATLLAGCGEHHAAPAQEASAPMQRPDALAGAPPADAPAPPPPAVEAGPPPPPVGPPPERPGDRDVVYDLGPVVSGHDTMAPIPNPPERAHARRHGRAAAAPAQGPRHLRHHHGHATAARTSHRHGTLRPHAAAPAHAAAPRPATSAPAHRTAAAPAVHTAPQAHMTAPAAHRPPAATDRKAAPAAREAVPMATRPAAGAKTGKTGAHGAASKPAPGATAEHTAKLAALQTALKDAVGRTAVLNAPELKPDQPSDVTLTLPADFASIVRDEADKQGLKDAAASVNMTALLSGDGYAVAPDEVQSQPLTVGQPTEFHWTVTAQPGAKGALHADVGADLLGGGDDALQLGSVSPSGKGGLHVSPRAWGAGLLVLLAVAVFAWLGRGGRAAAQRRRRGDSADRLYERPLNMGQTPPPPIDRRDV